MGPSATASVSSRQSDWMQVVVADTCRGDDYPQPTDSRFGWGGCSLKVIHIITDTNFGGAGRYLTYLLSQPAFADIDVVVACPDGELGKRIDAMDIRRIAVSGRDVSFNFRLTRELFALLRRERPDLAHTHSSFSGRIAARLCRIPVVYTKHGETHSKTPSKMHSNRMANAPSARFGMGGSARPKTRAGNPLKRLLNKAVANVFSDKIIAVSERVRDELVLSGIEPSMVVTIHNGIDLRPYGLGHNWGCGSSAAGILTAGDAGCYAQDFDCSVQGAGCSSCSVDCCAEYAGRCAEDADRFAENAVFEGISGNPSRAGKLGFLIGTLARLSSEKGLDVFVDAAKLVLSAEPTARFVIGGTGPVEGELRSRIRNLRMEPYVRMPGFVENAPDFLSKLDVFVLPSDSEGIGLAVMEAMAAGLPVAATEVGGVPEVVADGQTGILVPPRQPTLLAQAIVRLLIDPDLAKTMGTAGKARVEALFDAKVMAEKTVAVYRDLVPGSLHSEQ